MSKQFNAEVRARSRELAIEGTSRMLEAISDGVIDVCLGNRARVLCERGLSLLALGETGLGVRALAVAERLAAEALASGDLEFPTVMRRHYIAHESPTEPWHVVAQSHPKPIVREDAASSRYECRVATFFGQWSRTEAPDWSQWDAAGVAAAEYTAAFLANDGERMCRTGSPPHWALNRAVRGDWVGLAEASERSWLRPRTRSSGHARLLRALAGWQLGDAAAEAPSVSGVKRYASLARSWTQLTVGMYFVEKAAWVMLEDLLFGRPVTRLDAVLGRHWRAQTPGIPSR